MNGFLNLRVTEKQRNSTSGYSSFHFRSRWLPLNKIAITRVSTKIRDGSISEINQCKKGNILTKYDAFNPKAHNSTQILHISAPLSMIALERVDLRQKLVTSQLLNIYFSILKFWNLIFISSIIIIQSPINKHLSKTVSPFLADSLNNFLLF